MPAKEFLLSYGIKVYPFAAGIAAIAAFVLAIYLLKKIEWKIWQSALMLAACGVFFLVGARLLNYAINYDNYIKQGYSVLEMSFGHFSVYGGMALALVPPIMFSKIFNKNFYNMADLIVFPFTLSFAIMRVGCFLNGCCFGKACDVFWGVPAPESISDTHKIINSLMPSMAKKSDVLMVYPTQLMEMGFALLFIPLGIWLYKKYRGRGVVVFSYAAYFSAFRLIVLFFRELPYSETVVYVFYPIVYGVVIILCTIMAVNKAINRVKPL